MHHLAIGMSLVVATALLTGWSSGYVPLAKSAEQIQEVSPPPIEDRAAKAQEHVPDQLAQLNEKLTLAEQQRHLLVTKIEALEPEAEAFQSTVDDDQSVATSTHELGVQFAGKDWVGHGKNKRMDIQVRLENRVDEKTIRSVVLEVDVYRKGSDVPVSRSTRWIASSVFGFRPSTAVVRPIKPVTDGPFASPELLALNDRDIHLVIRPVEIRYVGERVSLQADKPATRLSELEARHAAVVSQIAELESQVGNDAYANIADPHSDSFP